MTESAFCRALVFSPANLYHRTHEMVSAYYARLPRAEPRAETHVCPLSVELLDCLLLGYDRALLPGPEVAPADIGAAYLDRGSFVFYEQAPADASLAFATLVEMAAAGATARVQVWAWPGGALAARSGAALLAVCWPGGHVWRVKSDAEAAWVVARAGVPAGAASFFVVEKA